jgi:molybdopterin synthase sulfur carrier subunit
MVTILYFASLRERLKLSSEKIDLPKDVKTVEELRLWLCARGEPWSQVLDEQTLVMMSVNQAMAGASHGIGDGDEIAFFPPVTGG